MIDLREATTVGLFGPVASGKTHLKRNLTEKMARVLALASPEEMISGPNSDDSWEVIERNPQALALRLKSSPYYFRIKYFPYIPEIDFPYIFPSIWLCDDIFRWLVIDELHELCPNGSISEQMEIMLRYSRHVKLGILGASQRIADVDKLFTQACRLTILFYTQESNDLIAIADRWGNLAADSVANLRPLVYDDELGTVGQTPQVFVIPRGAQGNVIDL